MNGGTNSIENYLNAQTFGYHRKAHLASTYFDDKAITTIY
jgi:hypothetical protein